ncbi:MAG: hypothetical protein GTO12_20345 [Proteobacteria bacterium]|nr:hypothetical protein [Pseudomonadota bacterium]
MPHGTGDGFKYTPLPEEFQYDQGRSIKRFCVLLAPTIRDVKKKWIPGFPAYYDSQESLVV